MKLILKSIVFMLIVTLGYTTSFGQCITTQAYVGANSASNQNYTGRLGLVFTPGVDVIVDSLGAYDSNLDGFDPGTTIEVGIVKQSDGSLIGATLTFSNGDPGDLNNMFRMKALASSITLEQDTAYILAAVGFNANDGNHNAGTGTAVTLNDGSGVLTFGNNLFDPSTSFGGTFSNTDGGPTGRYHSGTFTFAAVDNEDPVLTSPGNIMITQGLGCGTSIDPLFLENNVVPMEGLPTATDNCYGPITKALLAADPNVIDGWDEGEEITINGLTISYTQDTIEHPDGVCTLPGQRKYRIRRNWVVEDVNNNTDRVQQRINIGDQFVAPTAVASLSDIVLDLDVDCEVILLATTVNGASFDNCGINDDADPSTFDVNDAPEIRVAGSGLDFDTEITFDRSVFNFATGCPIEVMIELRVSDECENRDTTTKMITLRDVIDPEITTCISNASVEGCDETELGATQLAYSATPSIITEGQFVGLGGAASDACGIFSISYVDSLDQSIVACPRANPVVRVLRSYIVVDSCMNADTCLQIIDVNDDEAPTFNCPANLVVQTSDDGVGDCGTAVPAIGLSNLDDNCSDAVDFLTTYEVTGTTTNNGSDDASGDVFNLGVSTVEYFVEDCHGNQDSCEFTITVEDDEAPEIDCSMTFSMNNDPDRCSSVVCYDVEADDNCMAVQPTSIPGLIFVGSFGNSTYFRTGLGGNLLWEDANTMAAELGGNLVSITSPAEQQFIEANVPSNRYWIGLRYSPSLDAFKWTSGEDAMFFDWGVGQPGGLLVGDYVFTLDLGGFPFNVLNGWYDSPSLLPAAYIIEFEGPRLELIEGLASGSSFPVGVTPVTYRAVDAAGNADTCMLDVVVLDVQAPEITCPTVPVTQLEAFQCDSVLTFDTPTATDNCDATVAQIDMTGLSSGSAFPIGITELIFEAVDTSGNADTCSVIIEVLEFQVAELNCLDLNLSLNEVDCTDSLIALQVIAGSDIGCPDSCRIEVKDEHGKIVPNLFTADDIKQKFEYQLFCGGNSCWGVVTIEDYILPTVSECVGDTISCVEDVDIAATKPIAEDNCSAELRLVGKTYNKIDCDSLLLGEYILSWVAVDRAGNLSLDTCEQTIGVRRTDLDGVQFPKSLIGASAVACNSFENYKLENGAPSPEFAGKPSLNGVILEPFESNDICGGYLDYKDEVIHDFDCKRAYSRTWQIIEWHCDTIVRKPFVQLIEIVDKVAPTVQAPKDMTVSVDARNCTAMVDLPAADIEDNCNTFDVVINYGNGLPLNTNGGTVELTEGENIIIYKATDKCNNVTRDTMRVLVRDGVEPIAICETYTTVSLQSDGEAWVRTQDIDDGSFDDCSTPVMLEIRRMEDGCGTGDTQWTDRIGFCCNDVSATDFPMVALRVTDNSGNTNICMVAVEVQDKNLPTITCPIADTVVTCDILYDPTNPATTFGDIDFTGTPCPGNLEVDDRFTSEILDECRIGELNRTIDISFNGSIIKTCKQRIRVNTDNPIDGSTIEWPKDVTITNICPEVATNPDFMAADVAKPIVQDGGCNLVGIENTDQRFDFAGNGACFKIIRTWSVIDWCGRNQNSADTIPTWTREQVIVVENTLKPVITSPDTLVSVTTFKQNCESIPITLTASATDSCTPAAELQWEWIVTLEDGTEINGTSNNASGTYPIGMHRVDFEVRDKCGNIEKTGYNFEIINGKAPTAYCKFGLSTALVAMDTTDNNMADTLELAMITPVLFDNGSYHVCDYPVRLSFSSDVDSTMAVLNCNNIGRNEIELWVTDINGNQSFCKTFIEVIDTNDVDICMKRLADVSGRLTTRLDIDIPNAQVQLIDNETTIKLTDEEGEYMFADMPLGGDYMVEPLKDGDDMNGVSTLDLILIQRHILGIKEFVDPYTLIAADINNDDRVSTADLVALRKLVLGVYDEFPDNTSWRFVDENHIFPVANDPWAEYIKEDYEINYLNEDMAVNFYGVKIGDVNGSVDPSVRSGNINPRSDKTIYLEMTNRSVQVGEEIYLDVRTGENIDLKGLQVALDLDGLTLISINSGAVELDRSNTLYTKNTGMRISYDHVGKEVIPSSTRLFTLVLTSEVSGDLEDMISINEDYMTAEGYFSSDVQVSDISIDWRGNDSEVQDFGVAQNEPNPWFNETIIEVTIPQEGEVKLIVKDITGKLLFSNTQVLSQGKHALRLNKSDILGVKGVLLYEIEYKDQVVSKKMLSIE